MQLEVSTIGGGSVSNCFLRIIGNIANNLIYRFLTLKQAYTLKKGYKAWETINCNLAKICKDDINKDEFPKEVKSLKDHLAAASAATLVSLIWKLCPHETTV